MDAKKSSRALTQQFARLDFMPSVGERLQPRESKPGRLAVEKRLPLEAGEGGRALDARAPPGEYVRVRRASA